MTQSSGFPSGPIATPQGYVTTSWLLLIQNLWNRTGGAVGSIIAAGVGNTPAGTITSTDVQSALNELDTKKQASSPNLTTIVPLSLAADKLIYWTSSSTAATATVTSLARSLLAGTTTAGMQSTLGLGTISTQAANAVAITGGTITGVSFSGITLTTPTITNGTWSSGALTSPTIASGTWNSGSIQSSAGTIGWRTGAGVTVTQLTDKNTAVTANAITGKITTSSSTMAPGIYNTFTVNCSSCTATSMPVVGVISAPTPGAYRVTVSAVASGSFDIAIQNMSGFTLAEAVVIRFAVFNSADA